MQTSSSGYALKGRCLSLDICTSLMMTGILVSQAGMEGFQSLGLMVLRLIDTVQALISSLSQRL
jgi:hypothetical protein